MRLFNDLDNVIGWITGDEKWVNNMIRSRTRSGKCYKDMEFEWGNKIANSKEKTSQWTTIVGEMLVEVLLALQGLNVWKPVAIDGYKPDRETRNAIWEVKTRNWSTPGTAGEKILGSPFKYAKIPELYNKKLYIVLVGYQEYEAREHFKIIGDNIPQEKREYIQFFKRNDIEFIPCSKLLCDLRQALRKW